MKVDFRSALADAGMAGYRAATDTGFRRGRRVSAPLCPRLRDPRYPWRRVFAGAGMRHSNDTAFARLRHQAAARRFIMAGRNLGRALKHNPYWPLQPRVPAGEPVGGQWMDSGPLAGAISLVLPVLRVVGTWAVRRLGEIARRTSPLLRRVPKRWDDGPTIAEDHEFDPETRRIAPPSQRRPGHPLIRFRSERELREYLGPAGPDREWHHIVEKRLADNGQFPPELIHSTDNIINLPVRLHRGISARMSRIERRLGNQVVRKEVEKLSFKDQYNFGLKLINEVARDLGYDLSRI
ncbi:MAG: hypothetical protein JNL61_16360 [Rhizobiaceae bacterium]|nr:hypothetical protein [Rhizobiaceae bacterium]